MNPPRLVELLFPFGDPALWECPLQQGIPTLLIWAGQLILWAAVAAFIFGIIYAAISYMVAYGSDDRPKEAKKTLKWIFIGAAVIMLSEILIHGVAVLLASPGEVKQPPPGTYLERFFQSFSPQQAFLLFQEGTCGNAESQTRSNNRQVPDISDSFDRGGIDAGITVDPPSNFQDLQQQLNE